MRKLLLLLLIVQGTVFSYAQLIVDHRAISEFDSIPESYITEVKKMMVAFPGESHSEAMRQGMKLLEVSDSKYACNISTAEAYTDQHVRVENYGWIGELEWFTWLAYEEANRPYPTEIQIKHLIEQYYEAGYPISALGFTWCYDMVIGDGNQTTGSDPTYNVHWYGASIGGPDGDKGWGMDEDDYALTGNRVSLQTYFDAMEEYIDWSSSNGYGTRMIFTTGTVDFEGEWWGEGGYQGHIKHEAIRNYVNADTSKILFDYADILCHDDDGSMNTQTWNGHTYPSITSTNEVPRNYGHIADAGAIRLAKAQWWMLARMAGWEGVIYEENTAPTVPGDVTVSSVAETSVSLSWTASTDNVAVSGYRVYRDGSLLGSTSGLTYTDNSMTSCGSFSYSISAFDAVDLESEQSAALQVNTCPPPDNTAPTTPSMLNATSVAETSVSISWTASTDDVGVAAYNIYRSGTKIGTSTGLSFTDNTITSCGNFSYTVSASDTANNESAQSTALQVNTCPAADNIPPTTPSMLNVTSLAETMVSLSWIASTDDVGVTAYNIYRSGTKIGTSTGLSFTDNTITSCGNFSYTVSASDAADNESAQSTTLQVNTCPAADNIPPTTPSMLNATSIAETMVSLSWSASTDDVGVEAYNIYRSGTWIGRNTGVYFTDNTITSCGNFSYTVSAYDAANNESAMSTALQVNTCPSIDNTPPTAPALLDTTLVAETMVSLSWSASTDDVGVEAYNIYRSGTWIGTNTELSYTDNSLATCGDYSYTVSAYDAADNESKQSAAIQINTCLPDDPGTWVGNSLTGHLSLYPNPSGDHFMIDMGQASGSFTLEILSASGYTLIQKDVQLNQTPLSVNMEEYPAGIYYIRVYNGEQSFHGKQVLAR